MPKIEDIVLKCHICQTHRNQQPKEPMKQSEVSTAPWSVLAANLLNCNGVMYLVVIDYYSEFIEVEALKEDTKSETVIERLTKMFAVHGIPDKLVTDNGPQFNSYKFKQFATNLHFTHITTSPHHHKVYGMVEWANQKVRQALDLSCPFRPKTPSLYRQSIGGSQRNYCSKMHNRRNRNRTKSISLQVPF